MESKPTNVEDLFQKVKDYADVRLNLFKLKSINKLSGFMSSFVAIFILVILFTVILICLTIGFALLLGEWIGHVYWGFFIIGFIYLIIGLIFYLMRDKLIKTKVSDELIKQMIN
jgi:Zn-dependent protease with chaperone function